MGIERSRDQWRHVILEGQTRDPKKLSANISKTARDAIATIANY